MDGQCSDGEMWKWKFSTQDNMCSIVICARSFWLTWWCCSSSSIISNVMCPSTHNNHYFVVVNNLHRHQNVYILQKWTVIHITPHSEIFCTAQMVFITHHWPLSGNEQLSYYWHLTKLFLFLTKLMEICNHNIVHEQYPLYLWTVGGRSTTFTYLLLQALMLFLPQRRLFHRLNDSTVQCKECSLLQKNQMANVTQH